MDRINEKKFRELCDSVVADAPEFLARFYSNPKEYQQNPAQETDDRSLLCQVLLERVRKILNPGGMGIQAVAGPTREGALVAAIDLYINPGGASGYFETRPIIDEMIAKSIAAHDAAK